MPPYWLGACSTERGEGLDVCWKMQTKDQLRPNYLLLPTTGTAAPTAAAARALMWQTPLSLLCLLCAFGKHHCACYHPSAQTNVLCTTPTWPTWLAASVANLNMQTSAHCRLLIAHCIEVLRSATCTLHSKVRITHCTGLQHSVMLTRVA